MKTFKLNKSLTALFLAFTFVFTFLPSFDSMASTITLYGEDYAQAETVLKKIYPHLPLADGELTTRAEFTAAVVMLLKTANAGECETGFNDVPSTHVFAPYIKSAKDLGLISNVELFYPDSPITYAQAIKIVMCASGYGKKAELTGGFPGAYINEARKAGITLFAGNDETLSHAMATELIFEASVIDMMEPTSFGTAYEYSVTEGKNILSVYGGVFTASGVVSANRHTGLRSISSATNADCIIVDGESFYTSDYKDFIGKKVRIFYRNNSRNEVIHAYECDNMSYTYSCDDGIEISNGKITVSPHSGIKDIKHSLEPDFTVIYNGKCYNTADYSSLVNPASGSVEFTDNNANGDIDVINIIEIEYGVISGINHEDEKLYDKYIQGGVKNLGDSSVVYEICDNTGASLTIDDLEPGDAVGYVCSKDSKLIRVIKYTERVGGVLEYLTSDGRLGLGEGEYVLADYYISNVNASSDVKPGKEYILHIGDGNTVIYVQDFESSVKYGFLVASGQKPGIDGETMVKIFGQDGAMHEISLADKLILNGNPETKSVALRVFEEIENKDVLFRVVKYSTNAKGELTRLYQTVENTNGTKVFLDRTVAESNPVLYDDNTKHGYSSSTYGTLVFKNDTFYPYFTLAPDCTILKVPKSEEYRMNEKYYSLATSAEVRASGDSVSCYGYDVDMDGVSFVLWLSELGGSASVAEESANFIVESVTSGVSPDGGECYVLKLFADGTAEKYYSTEDSEAEISKIKPGDIIQISANADREITAVNTNFIYSTKTITGNATDVQGYNGGRLGLASGYFYNFSGKSGMIVRHKTMDEILSATDSFAHTDMFPISLTRGKIYFVRFNRNRTNGEITDAIVYTENDTSSIESYYSAGEDADYAVQRARFHDVSYTVIYVN